MCDLFYGEWRQRRAVCECRRLCRICFFVELKAPLSAQFAVGTALAVPLTTLIMARPVTPAEQRDAAGLVYSLWATVTVGSNVALFILLPFAYFYHESEGFRGTTSVFARMLATSAEVCHSCVCVRVCVCACVCA